MSRTTEQNARTLIDNANGRNIERVLEQYAEDASFQVPSMEAPIQGKEAIREFLRGNFAAFPDWRMDVAKLIVSGGETIVVNSVHGTHKGPLVGHDGGMVAPTSRRFTQDQLTRIVFNDADKVQLIRSYGDP